MGHTMEHLWMNFENEMQKTKGSVTVTEWDEHEVQKWYIFIFEGCYVTVTRYPPRG